MEAPLTPSGGRGEMALSLPRCSRLFFLHSEIGQDDGARCSDCPTGACSSQLYSTKCLYFNGHRHWSGASGRRVSFKLPWLCEQLWLSSSRSRARAGGSSVLTVEDSPTVVRGWRATTAARAAQRLAPGRAKSQVPRDARYWCPYQRRCDNAGAMTLSHKRAPPARATNPKTGGRLTQETAGSNPTTGQAAVIF